MKLDEYLKLIPMPNPVGLAMNNYKMTTLGKLFFASLLTSMATGQKSPFKVTGDPHKIDILSKAVQSSKKFQDELKRPGATVDSVIRQMDIKNMDAKTFERTFGVKWPI
jgi:hypothetical protein